MREALEKALVEEGDRLYALALRVTRDEDMAKDAVHDAFATALERVDQFRGDANLSTWLHRIVFNKAIDRLRRKAREQQLPEQGLEETTSLGPDDERLAHAPAWSRPPDEILLGAETRKALEAALSELTPVQRAVFELAEVEGLPSESVGERLGIPAGTARVHLHRARLRLRALLSPTLHGVPR